MYVNKYKTKGFIVRLFNAFGTGMSPDDTRVIPQFLKKIRNNEPIVIYGNGRQTRAHLHVNDLINGLNIITNKGKPGEVYNLGGSRQITIKQLAEIVDSLTSMNVEIDFRPHFIEDHNGRLPDTKKIESLGWNQRISLSEGLLEMMPNYGVSILEEYKSSFINRAIITPRPFGFDSSY
jgi:nucleoside-diphosphate-sugar epimerase